MKFKWNYLLNPARALVDWYNENHVLDAEKEAGIVSDDGSLDRQASGNRIVDTATKIWNDYTGQSQIEQQLQANKELAHYQSQMQEDFYNKYSSPAALMRQYAEAGLNPNLVYSSASSGQSNVPGYTAPSAPRNMSFTEKFAKGLSIVSSLLGLKNLAYQVDASRENAQQQLVKSYILNEDYLQKSLNNTFLSGYLGQMASPILGKRYFPHGRQAPTEGSPLGIYASAYRDSMLNQFLSNKESNRWSFGKYYDSGQYFEIPNFFSDSYWNNFNKQYAGQQRMFNYEWDKDYKNVLKSAGIASPIIQTLIRVIGGK